MRTMNGLLACCLTGLALAQQSSLRGLKEADPMDPFPEGPDVVCHDYTMVGEEGFALTPDQVYGDAKTTFPKGFLWGAATASYQIEGKSSVLPVVFLPLVIDMLPLLESMFLYHISYL